MIVQIKRSVVGTVIFECEVPDDVKSSMRYALEEAVKQDTDLTGANLKGADLTGANLPGAYMPCADLTGAMLIYTNLTRADLSCANLTGACMRSAGLLYANMAGAILTDVDLYGASLFSADLKGATLHHARLIGANLASADLTGALMGSANLTRANLYKTELAGASLKNGEKLLGERPIFQVGPIGAIDAYFVAYITDKGLRFDSLELGRQITREELEELLNKTHGDDKHAREYRSVLALIDVHAEIWTPI